MNDAVKIARLLVPRTFVTFDGILTVITYMGFAVFTDNRGTDVVLLLCTIAF